MTNIVNKNILFWVVVLILTASLFYMIGWNYNELNRENEPIKIENPEDT
ncbi:MAG: hypothetical protein ACQEP3_00285 [Patescibacteria group bacterium]